MRARHPVFSSWGRLEIIEKLGEGGFAEVFRAWDPNLERHAALKLLFPRIGEGPDPRRIVEEGRMLARIRHPNVVEVFGAEEHGGRVGIWMEYLKGRTLDDLLLERGVFGAHEAMLIGLDLCRALAAVHRAGLVHGDVKAANVMRAEGGRIVLMDFNAGRDLSRPADNGTGNLPISGTPLYMAPELLVEGRASTTSDLYSLGVLLYHLVTARFPVEANTVAGLLQRHRRKEARLLRDERPDLPESFVRTVERALAPDPAARYATAGEMEKALLAAMGGEGEPRLKEGSGRRRPRLARAAMFAGLAAAVVVAVVLLSIFVPGDDDTERNPPIAGVNESIPAPPPARSPARAVPQGTYTVEAALYRVRGDAPPERLEPGARLAIGDELHLEFQASRPLHVYVVDEDDRGRAFALFPLPSLEIKNPLPSGHTHRIPGTRNGKSLSWKVDTPGGREHLLILASPERLTEFEAEMAFLERPRPDGEPQLAVGLSDAARTRLRGIGGMAETTKAPARGESATRLFEMAGRLASRSEVAQGVWCRQIELENPAP
jgi:serine/threonine-protein kinase